MSNRWAYAFNPGIGQVTDSHCYGDYDPVNRWFPALCGSAGQIDEAIPPEQVRVEHRCIRCRLIERGEMDPGEDRNLDGTPLSGTEFVGPFQGDEYRVTVSGYQVPNITAQMDPDSHRLSLILDNRFAIDTTQEEARRWLWWVADAMAIASGYSSFGPFSEKANPFRHRLTGVSMDAE